MPRRIVAEGIAQQMVSNVCIPRSVMASAMLTLAALTLGGCGSASTPSGSAAPASQAAGSAPGSAGTTAAASTPAAAPKQWDSSKGNPCELLTQDAAAAALGSDPGPGKFVDKFPDLPLPAGATEGGGCVYGSAGTVNVYIRVIRFAGKPPADSVTDCEEPACTKIADLGDGGFVAFGGAPTMVQVGVFFTKGSIGVQMTLMTSRTSTAKQDGTTLGKTVAARL
jgi:hypothetical protein